MREVRLGTLTLGRGPVKVAVPLVGSNRTALLAELDALPDSAADLVEWRIDCLMPFPDTERLLALARELKQSRLSPAPHHLPKSPGGWPPAARRGCLPGIPAAARQGAAPRLVGCRALLRPSGSRRAHRRTAARTYSRHRIPPLLQRDPRAAGHARNISADARLQCRHPETRRHDRNRRRSPLALTVLCRSATDCRPSLCPDRHGAARRSEPHLLRGVRLLPEFRRSAGEFRAGATPRAGLKTDSIPLAGISGLSDDGAPQIRRAASAPRG